jgi:hypothetical protein
MGFTARTRHWSLQKKHYEPGLADPERMDEQMHTIGHPTKVNERAEDMK